jgi:hypothetical protein
VYSCWILTAILQGSFFFNEELAGCEYFLSGVVLILFGVYILSSAYSNVSHHQTAMQLSHVSDDTGEEEESPTYPTNLLRMSPDKLPTVEPIDISSFVSGGYMLSSPVQLGWYRKDKLQHTWDYSDEEDEHV